MFKRHQKVKKTSGGSPAPYILNDYLLESKIQNASSKFPPPFTSAEGDGSDEEVYIPPEEQDPQDLAWMREALVMVSY